MDKFGHGPDTPEAKYPGCEMASEVRIGPGLGEGEYPRFEHVAGAPGVGIGDKLFIDIGPEPKPHDLSHLFKR